MRKVIFVIFSLCIFSGNIFGQKTSKNNYTGDWDDGSSWIGGAAPATSAIGNSDLDLDIYGYIRRINGDQDLSFAGVNANASGPNINIWDTLIVYGDLSLANKAANLIIDPNGLLIVLGDLSATNKIEVDNGGLLIVAGSMSFSNSNQDDYTGSGELYAGSVTGNGDASAVENPLSDLETDYSEIHEFIEANGDVPLPVNVLDFNQKVENRRVGLSWSTYFEENFDYFSIERSKDGKHYAEISRIYSKTEFSEAVKLYKYTDELPLSGLSYYRLKATDFDGFTEYHGILRVKIDIIENALTIYPNPGNGNHISINNNGDDNTPYSIMNLTGMVVDTGLLVSGINNIHFPERLKSGIYFLKKEGIYHSVTRFIVK